MKKLFQLEIILSIFKSYLNENLTQVFFAFLWSLYRALLLGPYIYLYIFTYTITRKRRDKEFCNDRYTYSVSER